MVYSKLADDVIECKGRVSGSQHHTQALQSMRETRTVIQIVQGRHDALFFKLPLNQASHISPVLATIIE